MDYAKIIISSLLMILFYFLFGRESVAKLMQDELALSHSETEPKVIESPGCRIKDFSECQNSLLKECFC